MNKEWFTAIELAGLPDQPKNPRNVRIVAEKQNYTVRKKASGKGFEYHISSLPEATRHYLLTQQINHASAVVSAANNSLAVAMPCPTAQKAKGLIALNNLPEKARQKALAKLDILKAREQFVAHSQSKTLAEQQFDALYNSGELQLASATLAAIKQIHWRTLRRWQTVLDTQGLAALGGQYRSPPSSIEQQAELQQFLVALITAKPHLRNQAKALRKLALVKADQFGWTVPSESALQRWQAKWYAAHQAQFISLTNPDAYNNQHRPLFGRMYPWLSGPNQIWEFDSTPTDVMLNAEGKLRRYCVIAAIDVYTRRPTVLVSPSSNSEGICLLLRRCLLNWGMLEVDGVARTDNGSDYVSQRVSGIFDLLDIDQSRTRAFSGWEKPYVERFFGTLSRALFELLPGYIGHSVTDRQAIESAKAFAQRIGGKNKRQNEAEVLSLSLSATQLQDIIQQWIDHDYMHTVHDGFKGPLTGKTPFQVISESGYTPKRIANPHALDVLLNHVGDASIIRGSVKAGGVQYTAPELMESRWDRQRVRVFLDPADIGRATLYPLDDWGTFVEAYNQDLVGRDIDPAAFREARKQDQKALASFRRATRELQDKFGIDTLAAYTVVNKPFESSVGVDRDDIEDDNIGIYAPMMQEMGRSSEVFPDELLFPMLDAGTSSLCYDGQNFFDTDHPVYAKHDGTGAVTSVKNYDNNGGSPQTKWYLLDTSRALKPLIYQNRKAMQFTAMTKLDDEAVFTSKQFRYGVDCRANGGYGFWQMAYCSTKPLTAANIWAAIEAMRGFKADGGKPLGIKPNLLVVRGTQQQAALEAMKQTINGDTNTLAGQLDVLVADYL